MASVDISTQISASLYSTNVNVSYLMKKFMSIETGIEGFDSETQYGYVPPQDLYLDQLDPKIQRLYSSLTTFTPYKWAYDNTIMNIAYKFHGTTSTWWIILGVNPITSPFDLVPGLIIRIPLLAEINAYLQQITNPNPGTSYIAF